MADRDEQAVNALKDFIGAGTFHHEPGQRDGWPPTVNFSISGRKSLRESLIPFCDAYLIAGAKQQQYLRWRHEFHTYEARFPSNWGAGPSPCSVAGCDKPVRGRGLCRAHYYEATGY